MSGKLSELLSVLLLDFPTQVLAHLGPDHVNSIFEQGF